MASAATVKRNPNGKKLAFFSRFFEETSAGIDLFAQNLDWVEDAYCFPPIPMIGRVLNFLRKQKKDCVVVLPAVNASWVNLVSAHMVDLLESLNPFKPPSFLSLINLDREFPSNTHIP